MKLPLLPSFDLYSFILGILTGMLGYFLLLDKKWIQKGYTAFAQRIAQIAASTNTEKAETLIKKALFQRTQENHLLSHLVPLEKVLVPPHVLSPPKHLYPEYYTTSSSLISQLFPYVPEWPELSAQFPVDRISYQQLADISSKAILLGPAGSGKSVLLSALAAFLLKDSQKNTFPILVNARDILTSLRDEKDLLRGISLALAMEIPHIAANQVYLLIKHRIASKQAILLVDDLDGLTEKECEMLLKHLSDFEQLTGLHRILLAGEAQTSGKALEQQYTPLAISAWSTEEQQGFLNLITSIFPSRESSPLDETTDILPAAIIHKWIQDETPYYSPLEQTLRAWLLLSGFSAGSSILNVIDQSILAFGLPPETLQQLSVLAYTMLRRNQSFVKAGEVNDFLQKLELPLVYEANLFGAGQQELDSKQRLQESALKPALLSPFLTQLSDDAYTFRHPSFAGYFSSLLIDNDINTWLDTHHLHWTFSFEFLRFSTLRGKAYHWHERMFQKSRDFLFDPLFLQIARIVPDLPLDHPVRNGILKWIAKNAYQSTYPVPVKAQLFAALLVSRDPSVHKLLLDFQNIPDAETRFLAILTFTALLKDAGLETIIPYLDDDDQSVRNIAAASLFALRSRQSQDLLVDVLLQGDEYMKQVAAEALAMLPNIRKPLLDEAIQSEELLIRRAAVFGLARIDESWANDLLSHAAIEDAQWIVRNAATQIIENRGANRSQILPRIPHPSDATWLITFASKQGKGIPKSGFVKDILLSALQQGNTDEKIAAMNYLRVLPDEEIIASLLSNLKTTNRALQQATAYSLWFIEKIVGKIPVSREKRIT